MQDANKDFKFLRVFQIVNYLLSLEFPPLISYEISMRRLCHSQRACTINYCSMVKVGKVRELCLMGNEWVKCMVFAKQISYCIH